MLRTLILIPWQLCIKLCILHNTSAEFWKKWNCNWHNKLLYYFEQSASSLTVTRATAGRAHFTATLLHNRVWNYYSPSISCCINFLTKPPLSWRLMGGEIFEIKGKLQNLPKGLNLLLFVPPNNALFSMSRFCLQFVGFKTDSYYLVFLHYINCY